MGELAPVNDTFIHVHLRHMSCKNIMKKTIVGGCGEIRNGKAQQGRGGKYNNTKVGN
jgi:hypothetical protein